MREDSNFKIIAKIDRCLSKIPPAGILNSLSISNTTPSVSQDAKVKLPKLELPNFDGDIINWRGFWDQFQVAIHENKTIAEIDKFTYLKSFLSNLALCHIWTVTNFGKLQRSHRYFAKTLWKHSSLNKCTHDKICSVTKNNIF